MRTITSALQTELDRDVTTPSYLVKLELPGSTIHFSTGQETVLDGVTYDPSLGAVQRVNSAEATILLINTALDISNAALSTSFIDSPVEIRISYTPTAIAADSPILFKGFIDNPNSISFDYVKMNCYAAPRMMSWSPRAFAAPPVFNFLIPGGTIIGDVLLEPPNG